MTPHVRRDRTGARRPEITGKRSISAMATHDVKVTFPKEELIAELGNRDMKFTIKRNG